MPPAGSGMAVDVLPQPPAREHVHRLEPAADPEHRQAPGLGRRPCRRLERVALALHAVGPVHRLPVAGRVDVGAAAEEQAVHRRERRLALGPGGRRVQRARVTAPWRLSAARYSAFLRAAMSGSDWAAGTCSVTTIRGARSGDGRHAARIPRRRAGRRRSARARRASARGRRARRVLEVRVVGRGRDLDPGLAVVRWRDVLLARQDPEGPAQLEPVGPVVRALRVERRVRLAVPVGQAAGRGVEPARDPGQRVAARDLVQLERRPGRSAWAARGSASAVAASSGREAGSGCGPGVGRIEPGRQAAMARARAAPSTAASAGLVRARRTDRFTGGLPAARL